MARVTESEVKEVIPTDLTITSFIDNANLFVTNTLSGVGLSSATLTMIELYVAAHLVAITINKGNVKNERIGESQKTYSTPFILNGLKGTKFGQTALMLDTSGVLGTSGKPTARLFVL